MIAERVLQRTAQVFQQRADVVSQPTIGESGRAADTAMGRSSRFGLIPVCLSICCAKHGGNALNRFIARSPRAMRLLVGMASLMALIVGSGAGYKWQ